MIDPSDPPNPDGPVDADEAPIPLAGPSWLDDEDDRPSSPSERFLASLDPE